MAHEILLETKNLIKYYKPDPHNTVKAVDDVSFHMHKGEILSIVGESGSGKSTVAKCIMGIEQVSSGSIVYDGIELTDKKLRRKNKRKIFSEIQIVFQDTTSALNQRMTVEKIIAEPLQISGLYKYKDKNERHDFIIKNLKLVGLDETYLKKYPSEISGGQRQRVSIARALCMSPKLLVADEPIASLDVSIQAQIMNLFKKLQAENHFSFLLISHDLSMVRFVSDRVAVMCHGRIVEIGPAAEVCDQPLHPYTQALVSAAPEPNPLVENNKKILSFSDYDSLEGKELQLVTEDHWVLK